MRAELLKGLTKEQIEKLRGCKSTQEMLELAKNEDVQLTEEQLDAISGGNCSVEPPKCPICNSEHVIVIDKSAYEHHECKNCGFSWDIR